MDKPELLHMKTDTHWQLNRVQLNMHVKPSCLRCENMENDLVINPFALYSQFWSIAFSVAHYRHQ